MSIFKKRPALVLISFILGVFLFRYSLFVMLPFLLLSLISLIFLKKRGLLLVLSALLFAFGGIYTNSVNIVSTQKVLPLLEEEGFIKGTVISLPENEEYGKSAIINADGCKIFLMAKDCDFTYKDEISFRGNFSLPGGKARSFDFDYSSYLKGKDIYITCFAAEINVLGNSKSRFNIIDLATTLKEKLIKKSDALWDGEILMFARAILLGDTSLSDEAFREKVADASISHIIAVSGTHVSLVAAAIMFLLKGLSQKKRYLRFISFPFVFFFAVMVGSQPSVMRAVIMFILFTFAWIFFFHYDDYTSLIASAAAILLYNPFSAFSLNFLLSFGAILGIIVFTRPLIYHLKFLHFPYLKDCVAVTLSAQIFIFPILALYFGKIPFLSLLANILVVPLVPYIMGCGYVSLALPSLFPFDEIEHIIIYAVLNIAEFFGKLPFANIYLVFKSSVLLILTFLSFLFLAYSFFVKENRKCSVIFLNVFLASLLISYTSPAIFPEKSTSFIGEDGKISVFSVNKLTSFVLDIPSEEDFSEDVLIPALRRSGQSSLDVLALTEYNEINDELFAFLENFEVDNLILPESTDKDLLADLSRFKNINLILASEGDSYSLGNITLSVPFEALGKASYLLDNEGNTAVITGNLRTFEEDALAEGLLSLNRSFDVLIAPRSGNKGSCTKELLDAVNPKAIIVSKNTNLSEDFSERLKDYTIIPTRDFGDITLENHKIKPYKEVIK